MVVILGAAKERNREKKPLRERKKKERRRDEGNRFIFALRNKRKKQKTILKVKQSIRWIACIGLHDR